MIYWDWEIHLDGIPAVIGFSTGPSGVKNAVVWDEEDRGLNRALAEVFEGENVRSPDLNLESEFDWWLDQSDDVSIEIDSVGKQ